RNEATRSLLAARTRAPDRPLPTETATTVAASAISATTAMISTRVKPRARRCGGWRVMARAAPLPQPLSRWERGAQPGENAQETVWRGATLIATLPGPPSDTPQSPSPTGRGVGER